MLVAAVNQIVTVQVTAIVIALAETAHQVKVAVVIQKVIGEGKREDD